MKDEELKDLINSAVPEWLPCIGAEAHGDPVLGKYHGRPEDGGDFLLTVQCQRCGSSGVAEICTKYAWFLNAVILHEADDHLNCPICHHPSRITKLVKSVVYRKAL